MTLTLAPEIHSSDVIDGLFRYELTRKWAPELGRVTWVMLNPSTATRDQTDPTDAKVRKFTRAFGYGSYTIVNVSAYMATDPAELAHVDDHGFANHLHVMAAILEADLVIAAWGASIPRSLGVTVWRYGRTIAQANGYCLGVTKDGHPRHPLYLRDLTTPIRWHGR